MVKEQQPNQTASLIATNNDAVIHLQMGQLDESHSLISEAVATLQNMIREQPPPPESSPVLRCDFRWIDLTAHSNANDGFESSDQNGLPFLFQRCPRVDMPRRQEIRANRLCPFGLFPILHHNLALVAHVLGIQKAEYGKACLQEANRMYGMASAYVRSRRFSADSAAAALLMSIWNNQGCIYIELGVEEHEATHVLDVFAALQNLIREQPPP
jgi:hypothetical protein